ncbi:MAG TPA: PQQ-binding-like beta-propeller repeat protein, partial [Novosphingobium sp.]|nr:PQQ-binding-like beta-propeller repeat protein [Novosphingobium sp.]
MAAEAPAGRAGGWMRRLAMPIGGLIALFGLCIGGAGAWLLFLGGSWFYAAFGPACCVCGVLVARRRPAGVWLWAVIFIATWGWALGEVGADFWPLVPRVAPVMAMGLAILPVAPGLFGGRAGWVAWPLAGGMGLAVVAGIYGMLLPHGAIRPSAQAAGWVRGLPAAAGPEQDWRQYGRTADGQRYAPFDQINAGNVARLKRAWTYRTGDIAQGPLKDENTPLQVGDTLYVCTPKDRVIALDGDTGQQKWVFDARATGPEFVLCRSLGYADLARGGHGEGRPAAPCTQRLFLTTTDGRLMALDALSGKPCAAFGKAGTVDLRAGLGTFDPRFYFSNSGPLVIENALVVVGARVKDNQSVAEPSGVVRAFDAHSGALVWAWDLGRPDRSAAPAPGKTYTPGTPNMWTTLTYDPALGLVYLPLGNATPDFWGGRRRQVDEAYTDAVVAVDYRTGKERWHYRTMNHDLWDYDLPAPGTLYDMPDGKGGTLPALIQITKRGEIFVLDRRNGRPITPVVQRPVPTGPAATGDWLAPSQPYSVGMPAI